MKTPISREVLERIYDNSLDPFFWGLTTVLKEFEEIFAVIVFPDFGLQLLDSLDTSLQFNLFEFCEKKSLSFEIEVLLHFNHYDFEIELFADNCDFERKIKLSYDESFSDQTQLNYIHDLGKAIIAQIRSDFPSKT